MIPATAGIFCFETCAFIFAEMTGRTSQTSSFAIKTEKNRPRISRKSGVFSPELLLPLLGDFTIFGSVRAVPNAYECRWLWGQENAGAYRPHAYRRRTFAVDGRELPPAPQDFC
ncbi:MAG: hypothetical protein EOO81_09290 [Oxalobacteraceae bacterium]|nr:MAG: hypothetical protein EOO81_09290 [Oxalobacteraceae bacterium]